MAHLQSAFERIKSTSAERVNPRTNEGLINKVPHVDHYHYISFLWKKAVMNMQHIQLTYWLTGGTRQPSDLSGNLLAHNRDTVATYSIHTVHMLALNMKVWVLQ